MSKSVKMFFEQRSKSVKVYKCTSVQVYKCTGVSVQVMKYYECVSQYAVNLILEQPTKRAQSVRMRTDTTLDQDCVLKATVQVCTGCMIVRRQHV